jgi:IS1 family transposase
VPPTLRVRIYKKILNIEMNQRDQEYFASLKEHLNKWELVLDEMIGYDLREICNNESFFIFEEIISMTT